MVFGGHAAREVGGGMRLSSGAATSAAGDVACVGA